MFRRFLEQQHTQQVVLTLSSLDSKSLAISASDGSPPAVTSLAKVKVQYDSFAFFGAGMVATSGAKCEAEILVGHRRRRSSNPRIDVSFIPISYN